eukprot:622347-Rhodomonas_salina.10
MAYVSTRHAVSRAKGATHSVCQYWTWPVGGVGRYPGAATAPAGLGSSSGSSIRDLSTGHRVGRA